LIGLSDVDQESVYVWVDGRITDYLNWSPGEPNDTELGGEDSVGIFGPISTHYGMWFDISTRRALEFICERQLRQIEGNCDIIQILHVSCMARTRLSFCCCVQIQHTSPKIR